MRNPNDEWIFQLNQDEQEFMPLLTLDEDEPEEIKEDLPEEIPILALKNTVLFPNVVIPSSVGREKSIKTIHYAWDQKKYVAVIAQRESRVEDPTQSDLYEIGTIAKIAKILRMPDGTTTAILQGKSRFRLDSLTSDSPFLKGKVTLLKYKQPKDSLKFEALISSIKDTAKEIIELSNNIPNEAFVMIRNINNPMFLMHFITSNMSVKVEIKQKILAEDDILKKATIVLEHMDAELQVLQLKNQIESKVRTDLEKQQRDYFLNQQLKTIQEELGQNPQDDEVKILAEKAKNKKWSKEVENVFQRELNKLKRTNPQSAEYSVQLNYLELLIDLPWNEYSADHFDLKHVEKVLNEDHFGLEKVKERILEHLAVLKLKGDMKAPILCLVGPPGVGKTSLGKSIARALDRKFIRMSLGGLHDEAEIRGHRRTYIGSMPGRIIQGIRKANSGNPVFILDEVDKVGKDFRGDPSSALLEVLDPEQNNSFHDNYLETEYDLSKVLFIATANSLSTIQHALLDRMEIIDIAGYSIEEKIEIAKNHLIPKQLQAHGLKPTHVKLNAKVLETLISEYTRESGVRMLDQKLAAIMRHCAKQVAMKLKYQTVISDLDLHKILGANRYKTDQFTEPQSSGVAIGLAWTPVGGDILFIEVSLSPGKGKVTLTGNLGETMKESATTALSFIKARAAILGISPETFDQVDIHLHVPEGAIPKDGPSAGITMLTALTSAILKIPVKSHICMTGEITLRGKVLPVGGIKEKILAAKRGGLKEVILCSENAKHIEEIPPSYIKGLVFHYVDTMDEVLDIALKKWNGVSTEHKKKLARSGKK